MPSDSSALKVDPAALIAAASVLRQEQQQSAGDLGATLQVIYNALQTLKKTYVPNVTDHISDECKIVQQRGETILATFAILANTLDEAADAAAPLHRHVVGVMKSVE